MAGLNRDADEVIVRGSTALDNEAGFALFYLKAGTIIAADCVARPKEFMVSKQLVKTRCKISAEILADESIEAAKLAEHAL